MTTINKPAAQRVFAHRFVPITEDLPELTPEDGLKPPPFVIVLSPREKLIRVAVVGAFVVVAAATGAILA